MADTELSFETRLIGAEDVNWDKNSTNAKTSFTDGNGVSHESTLINASHVPLPGEVRALLENAENVSAGLAFLAGKISASSGGETCLEADKTVALVSSLSAAALQSAINQQPKNLGGYTLTFQFSEGIDASLTSALEFGGFFNGTLTIDLNEDTVSDAADNTCVFYLHDCHCKAEVKNGTVKHTLSSYGVKAERCHCVFLDHITFYGHNGSGNFAFYGLNSDGVVSNCSYTNDNPQKIEGMLAGLIDTHKADADAHSALFADKAPLASPAFTGTPTVPTAEAGTDTTQAASTAFVQNAVDTHDANGSAHSTLFAGKANTALGNISAAGKGVIADAGLELDWAARFAIPAQGTLYQATRAGILLVVGRVGPNGAGIGAWVYGDAQQQLYFANAGSYSSSEYNKSRICCCVVPKGAYYLVQQDDIAPDSGSSRFIPFKNSIAN